MSVVTRLNSFAVCIWSRIARYFHILDSFYTIARISVLYFASKFPFEKAVREPSFGIFPHAVRPSTRQLASV